MPGSLLLGSSLLVQVQLNTALSSLALVMHVCILGLLSAIPGQPSDGTAQGTLDAVTDALSKVVQLSLCLCPLSFEVLFAALLFEVLAPNETADGLFGGSQSLVPLALGALAAVFGGHARG